MDYEIDFRNKEGEAIKRLLWSTDLHFDAADRTQFSLFLELVAAHAPDMFLIGGDISNGVASLAYLTNLAGSIRHPIYYVLGNHDYYYSSLAKIREHHHKLCEDVQNLHYLTENGLIALTSKTALIGHDGWYDGRSGDYMNSTVMLNDYLLIDDLKRLNHEERFVKINQLGDESAKFLKTQLTEALKKFERVIILTHIPPFEEACLYQGSPADGNWLPHFVSEVTGDALEEIMKQNPTKQLLVLCGHSHWGHDVQILPNLRVVTGHSELGNPNAQALIFVN